MGRVIVVANQKGGVGKTTTAVNLCAALAVAEKKVLLLDFDPQGSSTRSLGIRKPPGAPGVYEALLNGKPLQTVCMPTALDFLHVAPANRDLIGLELELIDSQRREFRLRDAIRPLRDAYDYIYIDCPPSLGLLTLNSLVAADGVLIPVQCEYMALEGVSDLVDTFRRIRGSFNPSLVLEGVLLTMYDDRTNLSRQVVAEIRKYFRERVYGTLIPRNVKISEAPSFGKPVLLYDVRSRGAESYMSLAMEVLDNDQKGSRQRA